jgi:3-deoxy-D-manno-octulosonic-acid transferase
MAYLLYDFFVLLAAIALIPFYLLKRAKYSEQYGEVRQRLGCYPVEIFKDMQDKSIVWIHAASVGETNVALSLAKSIKEQCPTKSILISNVTLNGLKIAQESALVDFSLIFPLDLSFLVKKLLTAVNPEMILIVETEIWPNFCRNAHLLDIPLVMVNGRVSDRSYPRYRAIRLLLKPILGCFNAFCMQSQEAVERIISLGAPYEKVINSGNLKFDCALCEVGVEEVVRRKHKYRIPCEAAVIVAGSTHSGEEEQLLDMYKAVSSQIQKEVVLIMIPRYPERKQKIGQVMSAAGIPFRLRTAIKQGDCLLHPGEVLLVDTLGEVLDFYSVADLVFVGGSLVPVGGHNLLEAAQMSKPVLFGPYIQNCKEIALKLVNSGAGVMVRDKKGLLKYSVEILNDSGRSRGMGEAGRALIIDNSGAMERTLRSLLRYLS